MRNSTMRRASGQADQGCFWSESENIEPNAEFASKIRNKLQLSKHFRVFNDVLGKRNDRTLTMKTLPLLAATLLIVASVFAAENDNTSGKFIRKSFDVAP